MDKDIICVYEEKEAENERTLPDNLGGITETGVHISEQ